MASRVDVVVPCYNYAHFLEACVESILNQEGVDVRVLIIDDASPDNTESVGRELAARDSRVTFVRHATNKRHIATYNEGIDWLSGEYWVLLSADDLLTPGALQRAVSVMNRHQNVGLVYGRALMASDASQFPEVTDADTYLQVEGSAFIAYMCEHADNPVPTPTAVVRTSVQRRIGGYRSDLPHTGDMEMWMRIAAHADVCALKALQGFYRCHATNMNLGYHARTLDDIPERSLAFETVLQHFGHRVREARVLHQVANRQLGEDAFWRGSRAFDAGDTAAYNECMAFARTRYPELTSSRAWRRSRAKAAIGSRLWRLLRPLLKSDAPKGGRRLVGTEATPRVIGSFPNLGPKVTVHRH